MIQLGSDEISDEIGVQILDTYTEVNRKNETSIDEAIALFQWKPSLFGLSVNVNEFVRRVYRRWKKRRKN